MTITIKEKITEALENYRDAAEPLELFRALGLNDKDQFVAAVQELEQEGVLVATKKGRLLSVKSAGLTPAQMISQSKGFSFARPLEGGEDIYVAQEDRKRAMLGDTVLLRDIRDSGKGLSGRVEKIIRKGNRLFTGTVVRRGRDLELELDGAFRYQVPVEKKGSLHGKNGDKVQAILSYGPRSGKLTARILKVYGKAASAKVCADAIIDANGIPKKFKKETLREAEKLSREPITPAERKKRADLREQLIFTIDGADAKDLDDAISVEKDGAGWKLGVHIADVSHYVTEHSPLDKEALNRGTSVYLVDRVIPMLPFALSNGICSLNAGVDRLALSCMMTIDKKGQVKSHRIAETVIRVNERMSYTDVNDIVTNHKKETCERYEKLVPMFEAMKELALILRKKRKKKGSIDFDFPECKIKLDDKGHPIAIEPYDRNIATKIIEEFMLAANQVVAEEYFWMDIPFLYRTHEYPDAEKIQDLARMTAGFGHHIKLSQGEIHPREIQKLIEEIEGTKEEAFLSRLTLRAMKRAQYTTVNTGHFGLATQYYCHFTSPIRRYPDLQIHRIIKENLRYGHSPKRIAHYESILPGVAKRCSDRERLADEAEREVDKMKKVEYMQAHIGEMYEGIISGVTSWGIYVELDNTVEGMIRLADMDDDQYEYQEEKYRVIGHYSGKEYSMGQTVKIRVIGADRLTRTIDFAIADDSPKDSE